MKCRRNVIGFCTKEVSAKCSCFLRAVGFHYRGVFSPGLISFFFRDVIRVEMIEDDYNIDS